MTFEDFVRDSNDVQAKDHVELAPYNPSGPSNASIEIGKLQNVTPTNCIVDIQHVGSTAIPELFAKPIIDIKLQRNH